MLGRRSRPVRAPTNVGQSRSAHPRRGRRVPVPQAVDVVRHRLGTAALGAVGDAFRADDDRILRSVVGDSDADPLGLLHRLGQERARAHPGRVRGGTDGRHGEALPRGERHLADGGNGTAAAVSAQRQRLAPERLLGERKRNGRPCPNGAELLLDVEPELLEWRRRPDHARRWVDHAVRDHRSDAVARTASGPDECCVRRSPPRIDPSRASPPRRSPRSSATPTARRSGNATTHCSSSCSPPRCTWPDHARPRHLHRRRSRVPAGARRRSRTPSTDAASCNSSGSASGRARSPDRRARCSTCRCPASTRRCGRPGRRVPTTAS